LAGAVDDEEGVVRQAVYRETEAAPGGGAAVDAALGGDRRAVGAEALGEQPQALATGRAEERRLEAEQQRVTESGGGEINETQWLDAEGRRHRIALYIERHPVADRRVVRVFAEIPAVHRQLVAPRPSAQESGEEETAMQRQQRLRRPGRLQIARVAPAFHFEALPVIGPDDFERPLRSGDHLQRDGGSAGALLGDHQGRSHPGERGSRGEWKKQQEGQKGKGSGSAVPHGASPFALSGQPDASGLRYRDAIPA